MNHLPREASDTGRREGGGEEDDFYADKIKEIKKPPVKTCGITSHREAEFRHVIKLPEERKAQQFSLGNGRRCGWEAFV